MRAHHLVLGLMAAVAAQDAAPSNVEPCAAAASSQAASLQSYTPVASNDIIYASIDAQTAWDCVQSVDFDADGASIMLDAIRQYMSLHTNIAYLKNPPKAYQQPSLDVMGRLDEIADKVKNGGYARQWDFDIDLYSLEVGAHDEHFNIRLGTFTVFSWILPYRLTTISADGKALPKVYVYEDVRDKVPNISPVEQIEGQSVFEYLHQYNAKRAAGGLSDPHAEWNVLMWNEGYQFGSSGSNADGSSYKSNDLEATQFYNGVSLKGHFANGTTFEWQYVAGASLNLQMKKVSSGKSFFDNLIANSNVQTATPTAVDPAAVSTAFQAPVSTPTFQAPAVSTPRATFTAVPMANYPNPDTQQEDFGLGGTVSGYLLKDASVGVLSLPSFESGGPGVASFGSFSNAVADFIDKARGMKKVVIDIRGNTGGTMMSGFDTFQQFFPTVEPSIRFRTRATDTLNTIGKLFTGFSDNTDKLLPPFVQEAILSNVGTAAFINAALTLKPDDTDWPTWGDYYGPQTIYGDSFTNNGKWNLSSDRIAADNGGVFIAGYGNHTLDYDQPWRPEDIIILSDGVCGSTCSIFAELMKTDGGVRTVAIGGVPESGPMQSVAGTRGMNVVQWNWVGLQSFGIRELVTITAGKILPLYEKYGVSADDVDALPPAIASLPWMVNGRFNSLDEIRASAPNDPLQFTYQAADCRMFYTGAMIRDVTETWRTASKALDSGDDICVKGSKNAKGSKVNDTVTDDPGITNDKVWKGANSTDSPSLAPRSMGSPTTLLVSIFGLALALLVL